MAKVKIDQPMEQWDQTFAPSSALAMITTVDAEGVVNAASFGTCTRVCHKPVYVAFTVGAHKHTGKNILATRQFTVNLPKFDRESLERSASSVCPSIKASTRSSARASRNSPRRR